MPVTVTQPSCQEDEPSQHQQVHDNDPRSVANADPKHLAKGW